jgi:hypothetical protein
LRTALSFSYSMSPPINGGTDPEMRGRVLPGRYINSHSCGWALGPEPVSWLFPRPLHNT